MQVFKLQKCYNYPKRVFLANSYKVIDPEKGIMDEKISSRLAEQAKGFIDFANHTNLSLTKCLDLTCP